MNYPNWLNSTLVCPEKKTPLIEHGEYYMREDGQPYAVKNQIASLVYPKELNGNDEEYNRFYNFLAPFYDINERVMGRLITGVDIVQGRQEIITALGLQPGMKVLEVSPGPGVFQPYIREYIKDEGELVALDLSMGMLRQCQKKYASLNVNLVHGNAQYLPFADNTFDALFHFGGINLFNDADQAIREFIRVVKKGGIVSWGDEGFSDSYRRENIKKILLKMNPGFAKPRPEIPSTVFAVKEHEVYEGLAYLVTARKK